MTTYAIRWPEGNTTVVGSDRAYAEQLLHGSSGPFPAHLPSPRVIELPEPNERTAPMSITPTPEAFLALPSDPEDDDTEHTELVAESIPQDPLESIASSLGLIAAKFGHTAAQDGMAEEPCAAHASALHEAQDLIDELRRANADRAAKHQAVEELIDQVLEVVKPSVSKLANEVRATIEGYRNPPAQPEDDNEPGAVQPADDADVEAWREFARTLGVVPDEPNVIDSMNRSQIRSMLGLAHPIEAQ